MTESLSVAVVMAVCRSRTTVLLLLLAVLPHLIQAVGDYARTVSYADEMVVRWYENVAS